MIAIFVPVAVGVAVVVAVVMSIFVRRHGESHAPEPGWRLTDEVFRDPSTGRIMRVWVDQVGERHYVPEGR